MKLRVQLEAVVEVTEGEASIDSLSEALEVVPTAKNGARVRVKLDAPSEVFSVAVYEDGEQEERDR